MLDVQVDVFRTGTLSDLLTGVGGGREGGFLGARPATNFYVNVPLFQETGL